MYISLPTKTEMYTMQFSTRRLKMKLRDWLYFQGISARSFAKMIDFAPGTVSSYMNGHVRVSKKFARTVERVTEGKVTVKDILRDNPERSYNNIQKNSVS
jgi:hypothetical protein